MGVGVLKCPCGQTFDYKSDRDLDMKISMHKKFCDKLPGQPKEASRLRKAMTWEEYEYTGCLKKMYLSLVEHKIKTIWPIFKILLCPSKDFSSLNFVILLFHFSF